MYRRRRLVVVILLIVIVVAVWLLIAHPWRGSAQDPPASTPHAAEQTATTALPVPSSSPAATMPLATPTSAASSSRPASTAASPHSTPGATAGPCAASSIAVQAVTDQSSYAAGQDPKLSIKLTNNGPACTLDVGTATQRFTITSGNDTWWRSTDCQSDPSDMIVLLAAGQTVQSAQPLVWDRTRSSVSTCQSPSRPRAPGGGASYHLSVAIGGIPSQGSAQFILR